MISAKPFDYPYDGALEAHKTALIVIDLQEDFLSTTGYFACQGYDLAPLRAILPVVNRLIAACRDAGIGIVHTRQGYRADLADMTPYEKWRRRRFGLEGTTALLRSSPGFQIVPELDVRSEDIIVDKTCNSAFTYTDFEHVLRARGITHLLFSGCTTDVCVHSTLREACDRNFQCLTVSDACASGDRYAHDAALHMVTVENGIFGALADSAAVLDGPKKLEKIHEMSEARANQKYVSLMRLTQKGLTEVTGSVKRRKVSEDRVAALGGRSVAFYALLGPYDFVQVFEMPSNEAMMQYALTARRDGHVEPLILPAFDTNIYEKILKAIV